MADIDKSLSQAVAVSESKTVLVGPDERHLSQLVVEVDVLQTDQQRRLYQLVVEVDLALADPYGADAVLVAESKSLLVYLPDLLVSEQEAVGVGEFAALFYPTLTAADSQAITVAADPWLEIALDVAASQAIEVAEYGGNLVANASFETLGPGSPEIWLTWADDPGSGTIADETTIVYEGAHAVKITGNTTDTHRPRVYKDIGVEPEEEYEFAGQVYGDGSNPGRVRVQNAADPYEDILPLTNVASAEAWNAFAESITVPAGVTSVTVAVLAANANGAVSHYDNVRVTKKPKKAKYDLNVANMVSGIGVNESKALTLSALALDLLIFSGFGIHIG